MLNNKVFMRGCKVVLAILTLFTPPISLADSTSDNPTPLAGFVHSPALSKDTTQLHGVLVSGNDIQYSSPVIAEIDGNASNGKEVAVASANATVYVLSSAGTILWTAALPNNSCTAASNTNKLYSTPAVGEIYGDGVPYLIVSYGGLGAKACDGGVVVFRGSDGTQAWKFSTKNFAKGRFGALMHGVYGSPAVADTDGDGKMEIGFGSFDRNVYLLNSNGTLRWYYNAADTVWSSPGFADVDNDGVLELIIGTDITQNRFLRPPTRNGGYVYALKTRTLGGDRIFFQDSSAYVWRRHFNQTIFSAPVMADVLPEVAGEEIIIQSGCYFPERTNRKVGKWIKVLRQADGKVMRTLRTSSCSPSSVAVGDIDEDGALEIVATVNGSSSVGGDGNSHVIAYKPLPGTVLWNIIPKERGRNDEFGGQFMSPTIADVDGNGSLEVVVANGGAVGIFSGKDGSALTCQERNCETNPNVLFTWDTLKATPAIADLNDDGILDIVIGGGHAASGGKGVVYGWTDLSKAISSTSGIHTPYSAPWPMYRGNANHTGRFGD